MKVIQVPFPIEGLDGVLELREPSVKQVRPHMALMGTDTQGFMLEMVGIVLYMDNKQVKNADDKIGLATLMELIPLMTDLFGFGDKDEKEDGEAGNG